MGTSGLSKQNALAVTEPPPNPPNCAVAFQPFSVAKGFSDSIEAIPVVTKLPLKSVSPASHKAIDEIKPDSPVTLLVLPTTL